MLDSIMDWSVRFILLGVVFSVGVAFGMEVILKFMPACGGTKDQPAPGHLKIPADCPRLDRDYVVELQYPDGEVIRVLVPADSRYWKYQRKRICGRNKPFGLNLVCSGHYI